MKLKTDKKIPQKKDCYFWKSLYDFPVKAKYELLSLALNILLLAL